MRMRTLLLIIFGAWLLPTQAQFVDAGKTIIDDVHSANAKSKLQHRSVTKPTQCDGDTSMFPSYGSTAYNSTDDDGKWI